MMSGNDEEEEYNIINGEIPAPKQSYYKHKKQGTNYSKRAQKELNNTELKLNINSLALELGKQGTLPNFSRFFPICVFPIFKTGKNSIIFFPF